MKKKFRAWDKHRNQFIEDVEFLSQGYWDSDGRPIFMAECESGDYVDCEESFEDNFILQQYTGLKDRNQKEIYEGDILQTQKGTILVGVVQFGEGAISVHIKDELYYLNQIVERNAIIIGKIHENPELLKS